MSSGNTDERTGQNLSFYKAFKGGYIHIKYTLILCNYERLV